MAFGDVLAGFAEAAHQHHVNLLQQEYANRQRAGDFYAKLASDPRYATVPEQQSWLMQGALAHYNYAEPVPPEFKLDPKKPQIKIPVQVPATPGPQMPQPGGVQGGLPGGPVGPEGPTIPPPQPPAGMTQTSMINPLQPPPFGEQMAGMRAESLAKGATSITDTLLKSAMGSKIGQYPTVDPQTGQAYQMLRFRGIDPSSFDVNDMSKLRWREWEERSGQPLRPFAPRAVSGAGLSAEDIMAAVTNDVPLQFDHRPTQEEMAKITAVLPNAQLIPTGPNQWYVTAQHWGKTVAANGHTFLFPNTPSATADPFHKYVDAGIANTVLPRNTGTIAESPGVDPETGLQLPRETTQRRTTDIPGGVSAAPTAPTMMNTAPGAPAPPATLPEGATMAPQAPLVSPSTPGQQRIMPSPPPSRARVTSKQFEDAQKPGTGLRGIAQAISGDAASLEQYAPLAANAQLRGQMATVFQTLQDTLNAHADDPNFNVAIGMHFGVGGNLGKILGNVSGINQAAIQSEVNRIQNVLTQGITAGGSPEINRKAQNAVSAVMALFAVLPAMRNISGNPVYRSSMNRLELEIPTFFNVGSAQDVYQKLGLISRELAVAGTNQDLQRYLGKDEIQKWAGMRDRFLGMANMSNEQLFHALAGQNATRQ